MQILIASLFAVAMAAEPNAQFDKAKKLVAAQMRDPESAVFTKMHMGKTPDVVCGFVRGKNGFGGYANAIPFDISLTSGGTVFISDAMFSVMPNNAVYQHAVVRAIENHYAECNGP